MLRDCKNVMLSNGKIYGTYGGPHQVFAGENGDIFFEKYGVSAYLTQVDEIGHEIWLFSGAEQEPKTLIGQGGLVQWLGTYRENYVISSNPNERYSQGKFDADKIISRGLASYLARCEDLASVISSVPAQTWKAFPELKAFIKKYNTKFAENQAKRQSADKMYKREMKLTDEMWKHIYSTDFGLSTAQSGPGQMGG